MFNQNLPVVGYVAVILLLLQLLYNLQVPRLKSTTKCLQSLCFKQYSLHSKSNSRRFKDCDVVFQWSTRRLIGGTAKSSLGLLTQSSLDLCERRL